jgi:hypothetical protein
VSPLLPSEACQPHPAYNYAGDKLALPSPYLVSPIMSRTPSVAASDHYSAVSGVTGHWPQNPDNVTPAAAYVAPFGAVQVINEIKNTRRASDASDFQDPAPHNSDAQFAPDALVLINHFLDQLLYSILSTARSTTLHALRPAVTEVLRHRLAKEAVANADEELQQLLAGGEEEEENHALSQGISRDGNSKWDLELVWKRTRLRVMVYMRLGEMEDDDEERFVKEQELFSGREMDTRRFSSSSGLVSWSAAIFLTSVLEYVAEQSLKAAGAAVYARARRTNAARSAGSAPQQIKVEHFDVEQLALDTRLGRLWRTWRKSQRPMTPNHRALGSRPSFTRDRAVSLSALRGINAGHSRDGSIGAEEQSRAARQQYVHGMGGPIYDDDSELEYPEHVIASNIPLPMRDAERDIEEIEVPGLATLTEEDTGEPTRSVQARRNSFTSPTTENFSAAAKSSYFPFAKSKPSLVRQRSKSVPNPMRTRKFEMPGTFPTEIEDDEAPSGEPVDAVSEQKASAVEMQDDREESKVLLNDVDNLPCKSETRKALPSSINPTHEKKELASEGKTQHAENSPSSDSKDDDHSTGILSAVTAGTTAVATATAVATGYAVHYQDLIKQEHDDEPKSMKEDFAQSRENANKSSEQPLSRPKDRSPTEIEALDCEKTKADIKSVVATESAPREAQAAEAEPDDVPPYYRSHHSTSRATNKLEAPDEEQEAGAVTLSADHTDDEALQASRQDLQKNASNRADATTMAALEAPRSPSEEMGGVRPEPKARDMPMIGLPRAQEKPSRLILYGDSSTRQQQPSPITVSTGNSTQPSPNTPREYLIRNKSSNSEAPSSTTREHAYQPPNETNRAHAPRPVSSAATSPISPVNESRNRDSRVWHSPKEQMSTRSTQSRSVSSSHRTQNSRSEVQDHPAINSMATPKRDAMVATASESGNSTPPVVSTSIRGPKDFDNLLQGGDTVKYTLTPENVRDERPPQPTGEGRLVTKQTSHAASLAKLSGSGQASDGASSASSLRKNSTSAQSTKRHSRSGRSQSIKDVVASIKPQQDPEATREWRRSAAKPVPRNTSLSSRSGLMAREPQVMTASTRDFADFIRSTGPDREPTVQRLHTERSVASLHSLRNGQKSQPGSDGQPERTKSLTHTTMAAEKIPPVPKMPAGEVAKGSGSKGPPLQARSATGAASGNKDLINFIRDGPGEEGAHRISRSVAPFRNTMDSDQFDALVESASKAPSKTSTTANSISAPPTRSTSVHRTTPSANGSSSALLPAQNSQTSRHAPTHSDEEVGGRTRYRNKDPYAMPSDDEDEDDILAALPRNNQRPQEESLAEFLRSQEPPANNSPRPIGSAAANRISASQTQQSSAEARTKTTQAQTNGSQPIAATSTAGATGTIKSAARVSRIPRGNAGARLGAFEQTNTSDLADFLRSSGPTEEAAEAPAPRRQQQYSDPPKLEKKKSSFFSRFGGKREKV